MIDLDPSRKLFSLAQAASHATTLSMELLEGSAEAIPLASESVDTVVTTWTLCSIRDIRRALGEVRRVLAANGRLLFVEHGRSPAANVRRWQDRLTPIWKRIGGGCHLNQAIDALLEEAGFRIEQIETGYVKGPKLMTFSTRVAPVQRKEGIGHSAQHPHAVGDALADLPGVCPREKRWLCRRRLTLAMDVTRPRVVVPFCHRLAAILCVFALTYSSWAECAGWQASAEARRSCCEQSANCPGHKGAQDSSQRVTQAAADSCCAASESDDSGPFPTPFAVSITLAVLQPALPAFAPLPLHTSFDTLELIGPRASPIPKHLLLSVFLV